MAKKSKNSECTSEVKKANLKWTEEMDNIYIDAMLEQQVNGNKVDGTFTPHAYDNMAKPSAAKWRYTKIHAYGKLYELFSKDRANGKGACSAKDRIREWAAEESSADPTSIDLEINYEPSSPTSVSNSVAQQSKSSKKKARMEDLFEKQIDVLDHAIGNVAEIMRQGNAIAEKVAQIAEKGLAIAEKGRPHCYSEAEVFDELLKIEVPEDLQLDAFLFLNQSQQRMRAFFGVPTQRRKELLLKMMSK